MLDWPAGPSASAGGPAKRILGGDGGAQPMQDSAHSGRRMPRDAVAADPNVRVDDTAAAPAAEAATAYVPRILLDSLASHPDRPLPWWERVDGTLVMADVSGFTALSERLARAGKEGAEWLTGIINRFFGRMLDIALDCGGTTITFGGDAILLLFYGDDHERRGIAAALRMLHGTQTLPAYRIGNDRVKLSMSMGAHAGRILTASAGTETHAQYLVIGPETVKTAQAEAAATAGELAITPELARRVGSHAATQPLGDFLRVERLVNTPRYGQTPDPVSHTVPADLLARYVPSFVAEAVRAEPRLPIPEPGHEHRNVTVAFVNVLGVDELLTSQGPEALVDEVQRYLEPVVRLARENEGCVVSNDIYTDGFKLIVAFGAPVAHEHDAQNALRFAASLCDAIAKLGLRLNHRIGVHGGFIFSGDVGPPYRRQYTVMGDAVNLSARLMSTALPGQIIVSAHTRDAAGACFVVRELPPVRVKGKEDLIEVGSLEGQCEPAPIVSDIEGGFFGREEERAALDRALAAVEHGRGQIVVVRGEAGMGKSRLAAEFERALPKRGWTIAVGRAYRHTSGQPFALWVPVLTALLDLEPDDDDAARSDKALRSVERADPALAEWASLLNPLLHLSLPHSALVRSLDARSRRERMFDLVVALLRRSAQDAPLEVHLEDVHWADRSSIELLERVASACASLRVLVLLTERPDGAPELSVPAGSTTFIDLCELPQEAALALMGDALRTRLPRAAAQVLLEKTRGNPLFLQEVARSIGRSGVAIEGTDERELAKRIESIDVPDRVQGLLMSQIDGLAAPSRELLRTASVVGTTFDFATLHGACEPTLSGGDIQARLADLVTQSLLVENCGATGRTFDFRHALIQEVAYDSLPFASRRSLHHRVGEFLERSHREDLDAVYESLVHHYLLSGDRRKTRVFAVKAGEKARALLASDQAIEFFEVGLESLGARSRDAALARSYLFEQIGDCYHVTGRHHQAVEAYKQALRRCHSDDCRVATAAAALLDASDTAALARNRVSRLSHRIGVSYTRTHGDYGLSLRWLSAAQRSMHPRDAALAGRIDATRSVALLWTGDYEQSIRVARRAYATARRIGDPEVEGRAATTLAGAFQELGNLKLSTRYRLRALESYETAEDVPAQAEAHSNLAATFICRGELERALHHAREALKIDERTGDLTGEGITRSNLAEILVVRGDYEEAIRHLRIALGLFERAGGATHMMGFALMLVSRALVRDGRVDEAQAALEEAEACLEKSGATTFLAEVRLQRAETLLAADRHEQALVYAERGLEEARALGMRLMEIRGLWLRGRIEGARGDLGPAELDLTQSARLAQQVAAPYEQGLAELALAEVYSVNNRPYRRPLGRALELLESTGAVPDIERAKHLAKASA